MENTSSIRAFLQVTRLVVVLLLLGTFCSCHAVPLRGSFQTQQKSTTRLRMLMNDETLAPTREPTRFPTEAPSASPSWAPSVQPVIQTVQPVSLQLPTVAPSAAPSFAGSGMTEPPIASPPPTASPTSISTTAAPVGTMVPLADFSIGFRTTTTTTGDVSMATMRLATESYLLETMSRDFTTRLTNIELTALQTRRRRLQEFSQTMQYSGNAVFDGAAPSFSRVTESQTVALQDTSSLQMAYNDAGVNIVVQQVVVQGQASGTNGTNVGLIAGVSVAAAVVLALVAFCLYKCCNKRDKHVVYLNDTGPSSSPPREDFVKYTPDDFEPSSPKSLPLEENESRTDVEQDQSVEVDMDEYSLSAASVDSSVKKDPQAHRESLLKKLALYQKTEKKPPPPPPERIPMPTSLFVPQVIPRDGSELSLTVSDSPSPNAAGRQVSLLDQSGHTDSSGDEMEDDLLPPVPISTGKSSTWELDTSDHHQLVPSESPLKSQWTLSPHQQQQHVGEHDIESRLVPTTVRLEFDNVIGSKDSCAK